MMDLLAIDTATERCSVAARVRGEWFERSVDTQRGHADIVLTMVDDVLREAGAKLKQLAAIAYGRGPGAFTGVRIAVGVVQGLAYGAQIPTVGISNLAAVAHQVIDQGSPVLACMDARMNEVYWAVYERVGGETRLRPGTIESVSPAAAVNVHAADIALVAGTGAAAYADLRERFASIPQVHVLPRARDVLLLAEREVTHGLARPAFEAQPVYLRDQVTFVKPS